MRRKSATAFSTIGEIVELSSGKSIKPGGEGLLRVYGSNGIIGHCSEPLFPRGIIIGRVGAYCGSVMLSETPFWASDNTIVAVPRCDDVTSLHYTYYALLNARLNQHAGGAAQPLLTQRDLKPVPIPYPNLASRKKIAGLLTMYDQSIENNTRRIEILEEMAQAIYREWFVEFRGPGHEEVPLVDSDLGPIPEGWKVTRVDDIAEIVRGRSYSKSEISDSAGAPFINLKCISRGGGFRKSGLKCYTGPYKLAQEVRYGDIVIAVTDMTQERNVVGRAARVPSLTEDFGVISLDLVRVIPNVVSSPYLYGMLRHSPFPDEVKNFANGANVLHLHPDRIAEYRFARAPEDLQLRYSNAVEPMYELADRLDLQVEKLRAARDLLLPRLISGEIDVSNLDIDVGDAAA